MLRIDKLDKPFDLELTRKNGFYLNETDDPRIIVAYLSDSMSYINIGFVNRQTSEVSTLVEIGVR